MTTVQISSTFSLSLTSRFPPDISRDRKVLHRVHLSKVGKGKGKAREVIDNDKVVIVETLTKKGKKGQRRMKGPDTSEPRCESGGRSSNGC